MSIFTRAAAVLAVVAVVASCSAETEAPTVGATSVTTAPPAISSAPQTVSTSTAIEPPPADGLTTSFDELSLPGSYNVTVYGAQQPLSFGDFTGGAAWSTIKVPLSIAAVRQDPEAASSYMQQAITQSDNAAADAMWQQLGSGAEAAAKVQAILNEGGDTSTLVQPDQIYPPYSPYGQTVWTWEQAARFAYGLPCVPGSEDVLAQMRNVSQGWGLAQYGAPVKGGWGPDSADGLYLVRQIALVTNDAGATFGVSLAAKASDGSYESGAAMLTTLAGWVNDHRQEFPAGSC